MRYIQIAGINQRISRLLFHQQLISTVYGFARLYAVLPIVRTDPITISLTDELQPVDAPASATLAQRPDLAQASL